MFVRCTSSCSGRWLSSRVVATLLAIVPLLLLEPTRRPLLSDTGRYKWTQGAAYGRQGPPQAAGSSSRQRASSSGQRTYLDVFAQFNALYGCHMAAAGSYSTT